MFPRLRAGAKKDCQQKRRRTRAHFRATLRLEDERDISASRGAATVDRDEHRCEEQTHCAPSYGWWIHRATPPWCEHVPEACWE